MSFSFGCSSNSDKKKEEVNNEAIPKESVKVGKENISTNESISNEKISKELEWNYEGSIAKIPIKANLEFLEANHNEESGAISFPIKGYYYYESQKIKIPLIGEVNGVGIIFLNATVNSGEEIFDGQASEGDGVFEKFEGTWSNGKKELKFKLISKK
jgi:hypothetical protein